MKIAITHQSADFDGLATMLAVRLLWPDHTIVLGRSLSPPLRKYLALHRDWLQAIPGLPEDVQVEEVVIVDARDRRRFIEFEEVIEKAAKVTIYDHHPAGKNDLRGDREIIEPVGACVTLLCEEMIAADINPNEREATLLMLGLYADTGNLSFVSTTPRDLRVAAYLREHGGCLDIVNRYLRQEFTPAQQALLVELLGEIEVVARQGIEIGVGQSIGPSYVKGASLVVERVMQLLGLDACFAVLGTEEKLGAQLIGRSNSRQIDCGQIAKQWGGGGHASAAAARDGSIDVDEMKAGLMAYLQDVIIDPLEVGDVMTTPVQTVSVKMSLKELEEALSRWGVSGVPVLRERELAGVVSVRDVEKASKRGDWNVPVAGFMSQAVVTVAPTQSLETALELMTERDIGRLPVVSTEGEVLGIITRTDVLRRLYGNQDEAL